jgi:hypothetical protein
LLVTAATPKASFEDPPPRLDYLTVPPCDGAALGPRPFEGEVAMSMDFPANPPGRRRRPHL